MPVCEKCWEDAGGSCSRYYYLLYDRKDNPCTPEQQAGPSATDCPYCHRKTIHQHAKVCMNPACPGHSPGHGGIGH